MSVEAERIIDLYKRQETNVATYRSHCQDIANVIFPRENAITHTPTQGDKRMDTVYDPSAILDIDTAISGLMYYLVPTEQPFFALQSNDRRQNEIDWVKRYFSVLTEVVHDKMFQSNFLMQYTETLKSKMVFGTSNIRSGFKSELYYTDYDISKYVFLEDYKGDVDTVLIKDQKTARQAAQEWGDDCCKSVTENLNDPKKENDYLDFIWVCRPREKRNTRLEDSLNMPLEVKVVSVKDKEIVFESGSPEMQYHVGRWSKSSGEITGRGQGMMVLPAVNSLQSISRDFEELVNRHNNPPREILESAIEAETVDNTPNANNWVTEMNSIRALEGLKGNFPETKDYMEMRHNQVRRAFFLDVFDQLGELKGDRRTTLEIRERLREGFQKIGRPIYRIYREDFNPLITRTVNLLIRNGVAPPPPAGLSGFKIEYVSELAMALKSKQARGAREWLAIVGDASQLFPNASDIANTDEIIRDIGISLGVKTEHIRSEEEIEAIRQQRQAEAERQKALEAAQVAGQAYGQTTKAPEDGSAAQQLQEAISG
jgi:hypothetical protein